MKPYARPVGYIRRSHEDEPDVGLDLAGIVESYELARATARSMTSSNIGTVNRPVNVFCWLGWYEPRST